MGILRDYLVEHGIMFTRFATRAGISKQYIHDLLSGERVPSLALAERIENLTDGKVKASDLREGK